jgi:hypothetical protein
MDFKIDGIDLASGFATDLGNGFTASEDDFTGTSTRKVDTQYIKPPLYIGERRKPVKYDHAQKLADELYRAIFAGERIDCLVSGNFIFGDFIESLAVSQDEKWRSLIVSTLSLSKENADSLTNIVTGDFTESVGLIVSDYWYSHNKRNIPYLLEEIGQRPDVPFKFAVSGTHTKFVLIEGQAGQKIVMHGSANLRSSGCVEYFTVETSPELYDFHYAWHAALLDAYQVKPKALRRGNLWSKLRDL